MAAYAYQQNFYDGASAGYVKFNVSPDLGTPVAPGEQITFEGEVYSRDYAIANMSLSLYDTAFSNWIYPAAGFSVSAKKARATVFKIVLSMPGAADWFPAGRTVPLAFKFSVARADGSGDVLAPTAPQQLLWLRYRIKPEILRAEFYRYGINGDTGLYERMNDGNLCMCAGLQLSLASGCSAADITVARITTTVQGSAARVSLTSDVLESALAPDGYVERTGPGIFADMSFHTGSAHTLLIEIGDEFDIAAGSIVLPRSFANMCLCNFVTGGVSFGGFPKSKAEHPLFENYYPARFYGGFENIQAGYIPAMGSTPAGENKDGNAAFAHAYKDGTVPVVVIGFKYKSDIGDLGYMGVAVTEVTNKGFDFRFYNNDTGARNPEFTYIAFGIPADGIPEKEEE